MPTKKKKKASASQKTGSPRKASVTRKASTATKASAARKASVTKKASGAKSKSRKVKKAAPEIAPSRSATPRTSGSLKSTLGGGKHLFEDTAVEAEEARSREAGQAGSLQGLSDVAQANSESVDELIEEGNPFEAEAIKGVEDAPDPDQGEVRTHEVPENDVPEEYLDEEQ